MTGILLALAERAAPILVASWWQGGLLAVVVWVCLRVLPQVSAAQRFAVWAAAFAVAVALPFVALPHGPGGAVRLPGGWGAGLAAAWFAMVAVRGGGLVSQGLRLRSIWRAAEPVVVSGEIAAALAAYRRAPGVYVSRDVTAPSVIGFLAPRLLVPAGMLAELGECELRQIVLHECEHLRRYDDWLNLLQKMTLAVFPLNPALVWVDRRLGLERELACDAGVIAATGAPLEYASCLARLAEHRLSGGRLALALSAWARRSELARRVYTLLSPVRSSSRMRSQGALAAAGLVLMVAAAGIARVPRLVTFGAAAPMVEADVVQPVMGSSAMVPVSFHAPVGRASVDRVSCRRSGRRAARSVRLKATRWADNQPRVYNTLLRPRREPGSMVAVQISYSYAAVPFGDGWLIVQL